MAIQGISSIYQTPSTSSAAILAIENSNVISVCTKIFKDYYAFKKYSGENTLSSKEEVSRYMISDIKNRLEFLSGCFVQPEDKDFYTSTMNLAKLWLSKLETKANNEPKISSVSVESHLAAIPKDILFELADLENLSDKALFKIWKILVARYVPEDIMISQNKMTTIKELKQYLLSHFYPLASSNRELKDLYSKASTALEIRCFIKGCQDLAYILNICKQSSELVSASLHSTLNYLNLEELKLRRDKATLYEKQLLIQPFSDATQNNILLSECNFVVLFSKLMSARDTLEKIEIWKHIAILAGVSSDEVANVKIENNEKPVIDLIMCNFYELACLYGKLQIISELYFSEGFISLQVFYQFTQDCTSLTRLQAIAKQLNFPDIAKVPYQYEGDFLSKKLEAAEAMLSNSADIAATLKDVPKYDEISSTATKNSTLEELLLLSDTSRDANEKASIWKEIVIKRKLKSRGSMEQNVLVVLTSYQLYVQCNDSLCELYDDIMKSPARNSHYMCKLIKGAEQIKRILFQKVLIEGRDYNLSFLIPLKKVAYEDLFIITVTDLENIAAGIILPVDIKPISTSFQKDVLLSSLPDRLSELLHAITPASTKSELKTIWESILEWKGCKKECIKSTQENILYFIDKYTPYAEENDYIGKTVSQIREHPLENSHHAIHVLKACCHLDLIKLNIQHLAEVLESPLNYELKTMNFAEIKALNLRLQKISECLNK